MFWCEVYIPTSWLMGNAFHELVRVFHFGKFCGSFAEVFAEAIAESCANCPWRALPEPTWAICKGFRKAFQK